MCSLAPGLTSGSPPPGLGGRRLAPDPRLCFNTPMRILSSILAGLLLGALLTACGGSEQPWLQGTWTLAHNPQQDSEDVLEFDGRGRVTIRTAGGETLRGRYELSGDMLSLSIERDGREAEADFEVSSDRRRLTYHTGAYYLRAE